MPKETTKKNEVDMDKQFDIISLSRNNILDRFVDYEEELDEYRDKVKTALENMSDNDVRALIDEFCSFKNTFTIFYENMSALVKEWIEKVERESLV